MMDCLISVVIPCYNCKKFIFDTLNSVYSQECVDFEVILIDDGSTDGSGDFVRNNFSNVHVYIHSDGINLGFAHSINLAVSKSKGKYIAFLDSDDLWIDKFYLFKQANNINKTNAVLSFCNSYAIDVSGNILWKWNSDKLYNNFDKRLILQNCFLLTGSTMVDKLAFQRVGGMDTSLQSADHDLWIKLAEIGDFVFLSDFMFGYRQHPNQISQRRRQWEDGFAIIDGVKNRGFFSNEEIQKRKAVLHYRLFEHDFRHRKFFKGCFHALKAFFLDPTRALKFFFFKCIK